MSRKTTKNERVQVSYYPSKKVREITAEFATYGFATKNEMIDQCVLAHVETLKLTAKERPYEMLKKISAEAALAGLVRIYHFTKASYQEDKFSCDKDLGIALLRSFARMKEPPVDTEKESEVWRRLINGEEVKSIDTTDGGTDNSATMPDSEQSD